MRHSPTRTRLAGLGTALALAAGVLSVGAVPATAGPDDGLHSLEHQRATGAVRSPDGTLRKGCQSHSYTYRVNPAGTDWSLEVFLVDPEGRELAYGYEFKGNDPTRGRGRFTFCAQSTHPGRFTVRTRLTWDDGEYHETWLERRSLRLRAA